MISLNISMSITPAQPSVFEEKGVTENDFCWIDHLTPKHIKLWEIAMKRQM